MRQVECNIDDMNPEWYDFIFQKLFEVGASDVFLTPIIMKKSRPANQLTVLCVQKLLPEIKETIFNHTTSIGLREYPVKKSVLARNEREIETDLGPVRIKSSFFRGEEIHIKPEFEDLRKLASLHGLSIKEVEKIILKNL